MQPEALLPPRSPEAPLLCPFVFVTGGELPAWRGEHLRLPGTWAGHLFLPSDPQSFEAGAIHSGPQHSQAGKLVLQQPPANFLPLGERNIDTSKPMTVAHPNLPSVASQQRQHRPPGHHPSLRPYLSHQLQGVFQTQTLHSQHIPLYPSAFSSRRSQHKATTFHQKQPPKSPPTHKMRFLQVIVALLSVLPMTTGQAWMLSRPKKPTKSSKPTVSPSVVYYLAEAGRWPLEPGKWPSEVRPSATKMNATCSQCLITDGWVPDARHGSVLQCYCLTWYGWYHTAYFFLSKKVGNNNGRLVVSSSRVTLPTIPPPLNVPPRSQLLPLHPDRLPFIPTPFPSSILGGNRPLYASPSSPPLSTRLITSK